MKNFPLFFALLLSSFLATQTLAQQQNKVEFIPLLGDALFPEGIITLPNQDLLVGGFGDGSIQRINRNNEAVYFSKPRENGIVIAVGMAVDIKRNQLWVANFNFKTESGNPGSNLKVFDLSSGSLVKTIPEKFVEGVFFNELAIDDRGRVFVTNTFGPQVWMADINATEPQVFVQSELLSNPAPDQPFDLNGLAITPDKKYLVASVMDRLDAGDGKLVRINIGTREVSRIQIKGSETAVKAFAGSDGMFFHGGQLFMVNVYAKAGAIMTATFNGDFSEATLRVRNAFNDVYDRPTASAVRNGKLFTVNSQLNHIIDDADGQLNTPHEKPFKVVSVPLKDLLK
jgi:DNA-binding beta-propeller fold protein YncE